SLRVRSDTSASPTGRLGGLQERWVSPSQRISRGSIRCRPTIPLRAATSSVSLGLSLKLKKLDCSFGVHSLAACSQVSLVVRTRDRKAPADLSSIFPSSTRNGLGKFSTPWLQSLKRMAVVRRESPLRGC